MPTDDEVVPHPQRDPAIQQGAARKQVAVLGAGVAGLVAAYELSRLGHDVTLYEGSGRIGGRVRTHRFGTGPHAPDVELGAMRLPSHHRNVLHYVNALGLGDRLRKFETLLSNPRSYIRTVSDTALVSEASPTLVDDYLRRYPHSGHRFESVLFVSWLNAIIDAISPAELRSGLADARVQWELLDFVDAVDVRPFLPEHDRPVDLAGFFLAYPAFRTVLGPQVSGFVDDILTETSQALLRIDGGMDQFTNGLASRLPAGTIRLRHHVTGIATAPDGVTVEMVRRKRITRVRSDHVLCTIPFSVLRRLHLSGMDPQKLRVIRETRYCSTTKVALHCREPFWESNGLTGGASISGGNIRQTYYSSSESADPRQGAALLASYTLGEEADRLGHMPKSVRHVYVRDQLAALHPELRDAGMVLGAASGAWGQEDWSLGGCCVRWGKSEEEVKEELAWAAQPQNRLYFAGEHTSATPAWVEGAVESALTAVDQIVGAPALVGTTLCHTAETAGLGWSA